MTDVLASIGVADANLLGALLPAFNVVQRMSDTCKQIKLGGKRCKAVVQQAALIIREVHGNSPKGPPSKSDVAKLQSKLEEVQIILQTIANLPFFKALLYSEDVNKAIERAYSHLVECSKLFPMINLSSQVQAQSRATLSDREALRALLRASTGNYEEMRHLFGICNDEQEDQAMAVIERELRNARVASEEDLPVEMQLMQKGLECIKTTTGRSAPKQRRWLITEYDLEDCGKIGGGAFATVSKARFRYTMVAVKRFKDTGNMREVLEREVEIWSKLHHDHIVPFYGASTLSSPPFIVSRYMQNGNLVQYLAKTPHADRTKLLFEVSLGMYYLHEEDVVHGDLKGVNVLVDDAGKACIADFGLSKVRSSGKTGSEAGKIAGTLRFLAPEALRDEPLSFETDVYAFGMLIYQVFTEEVPFIRESDDLVRECRLELQRPTSDRVYRRGFNDTHWQLLSDCVSRSPSVRPHFKTIQATLYSLKKAEPSTQSVDPDPLLGTEERALTDWNINKTESMRYASRTLLSSPVPVPKESSSSSGNQLSQSSKKSVPSDFKAIPATLSTCIEVDNKYFDVKFSTSSREPAAYLEETGKWHFIRAQKGSLSREDGNKFWYKSTTGSGDNSWELNGVDVTLRTQVNTGICRFKDAMTAQRWFRLQLSYARGGNVGDWGTAIGDWFYTERSWRRLASGKLQQANLVDGDPEKEPTENWSDVSLPKRCIIDEYAGNENCIVCTTNPGRQPGTWCCKLEGNKVIFETYRRQGDKEPITIREETYPSGERAEATFHVLKAASVKAGEKNNKTTIFSF